jgi:O-antigen/teichoic acid export membrane protein
MLSLLGHRYAAAGAAPLRILVLAILPLTFIQAYYGACRATHRLPEALCTGAVSGALSIAVAAVAGPAYGLKGMAAAWLGAQLVTGAWAGWRLWRVSRNVWGRSTSGSVVLPFGTAAEAAIQPPPAPDGMPLPRVLVEHREQRRRLVPLRPARSKSKS